MTFHSRSITELGHLISRLSRSFGDGVPLEEILGTIRNHFEACGAALEQRGRHIETTVLFSIHPEIAACISERGPDLSALCDSYHSISLTETGADETATYVLWLFRARDTGKFDAEETAMAGIITSQLARSIELARRMGSSEVERTLYSDVLDKLNVGVAIVDCSGRVANASAVARRFLSDRDGLQLQGGKIRAVNSMEDRELQGAIKAAAQRMPNGEAGPSRGLSLTKHSGARTLGVMIRPVSMGATSGNTGVAIYIRDCDLAPDVESEFVRQIFDLTPAEAAVTRRLTAGLSLEDAATSLDISRNTARAHLRSIFSKSGITRQTELVRLVLNSAVILGERSGHQTA